MKNEPKKILIVEDESAIRDMITYALAREFKLYNAKDVNEARKKIAEAMPDLILLDWMLPGKSGIDFILSRQEKDGSFGITNPSRSNNYRHGVLVSIMALSMV